MKTFIYSIKQTDLSVIITTKSGIVKIIQFDTIAQCNEYYTQISK